MSDTPETQEAVERWRQGKINLWDEMARIERERNAAHQESAEQATLLGKGSEREVALLAKLEMQKKDILSMTESLEDIRNGYEGTCYACECVGELNQKYRDQVRELIRLLEIEEESDSGHTFRPNKVSSCRVMDGMQINQCLKALKELAQE